MRDEVKEGGKERKKEKNWMTAPTSKLGLDILHFP